MVEKSQSKADGLRAMREANYAATHSRGSRAEEKSRPHGASLQQGTATSSKPSTAAKPRGKGSDAANVAKPQPDPVDRESHQAPREAKSKGGRPLAKDADKALMKTQPWKAEGMSRASWYRRQAEKAVK